MKENCELSNSYKLAHICERMNLGEVWCEEMGLRGGDGTEGWSSRWGWRWDWGVEMELSGGDGAEGWR